MQPSESGIVEIGLRVYPTYVVQYPIIDKSLRQLSARSIANQKNLTANNPAGSVSQKADKRIRNAVNWLASSAQFKRVYCKRSKRTYGFKLNFVTLTLPSLDHGITDRQFKSQLLRKWLDRMLYRYNLQNYVWRVETQANGNIHAHITTDVFMHYADIREAWNDILIKAGLMKSFAAKHGHSDPNSTDVKSVKSINDLAAYLAKYFTKDDEARRLVSGKLWASSYSLSDRRVCNIIVPPSDDDGVIASLVSANTDVRVIESEPDSFGHRRKVATVYFMRPCVWQQLQNSAVAMNYRRRLQSIRERKPEPEINSLIFSSYEYTKFNSRATSTLDQRAAGHAANDARQNIPGVEIYRRVNPAAIQLDLFQSIVPQAPNYRTDFKMPC